MRADVALVTGPVLADPELEIVQNGSPAIGRTRDILPDKLPDLFEGDQLLLLGQYVGDKPIKLTEEQKEEVIAHIEDEEHAKEIEKK